MIDGAIRIELFSDEHERKLPMRYLKNRLIKILALIGAATMLPVLTNGGLDQQTITHLIKTFLGLP